MALHSLSCPLDVVEGSKAEDADPVARTTGELSEQLTRSGHLAVANVGTY